MDRTVVALFDDVSTAQRALEDLLNNGFERSDISLVRTNQDTGAAAGSTTTDTVASGAATGAGVGAALGGIAGLVIGLGVLAIPGIGPVIAAGPLATTLAGAGIGAATGGIIGALTDVGIPETEAGYYMEGIRRGGTLLTVHARDNQVNQATHILNQYSPVDINQRASEWRTSGWTGYDTHAGSIANTTGHPASGSTGSSGVSGGMGVGDSMGAMAAGSAGQYGSGSMSGSYGSRFEDFDSEFRSDWQTRHGGAGYGYERYQPAYRYGWEARNRYQDRNWNDVETDLRSDWQRSHPNDAWEDFKDSIRTGWERFKQGARDVGHDIDRTIDRAGDRMRNAGQDMERSFDRTASHMSRSFDQYDRDFRNDWERSYRSRGYGYERYQPAYQYGYRLANENRYRGRQWNDIEMDVRRDWETQHPSDAWEDFKDAVKHAWQRVRADVRDAID